MLSNFAGVHCCSVLRTRIVRRRLLSLWKKSNPAEAIQHYQKALELAPKSISTLTNLAWLLATSQDASLRNGAKAIELATQADRLLGGTNTLVLRTLAAAYAENGEFTNAIRTARSAMQLARMYGEDSLTADLGQQIALYQLGCVPGHGEIAREAPWLEALDRLTLSCATIYDVTAANRSYTIRNAGF